MAMKKRSASVRYSIAEARDSLPRVVHQAEAGATVELTRRGKPVAVLLSVQAYQQAAGGSGFWQAVRDFRSEFDVAQLRIGREFLEGLRDRSRGRAVRL